MKRRRISHERQASYYLGMALCAVGVLTFGSVFVTGCATFGDFSNFESNAQSSMVRAIAGMVMLAAGQFLMRLGARGLAGSGVVLDPERARRDVEPWSRMAGGVAKDALDEAGIRLGSEAKADDLPFDEKLRRLHKLHEDGVITTAEYEREKREILDAN